MRHHQAYSWSTPLLTASLCSYLADILPRAKLLYSLPNAANFGGVADAAVALNGGAAMFPVSSFSRTDNTMVNSIRLTPRAQDKRASAWFPQKIATNKSFMVQFGIQMRHNGTGADGLAFVIQDDPHGLKSLGEGGCGLGYAGIERRWGFTWAFMFVGHFGRD
jgi:hypothetical protein